MFSNGSYRSALAGDGGTYKSIAFMPLKLFEKYQNDVAPHLVHNNHLINLALAVVLLLLWLTKNAKGARQKYSWNDKFWCFCGIALIAFFAYDMVENTWTQAFYGGKSAFALMTLVYAAYILVTIWVTVTEKEGKWMLLLLAVSQVVLTIPLVPAAPLSARCFFQNGILWAMLLGSMLQILLERCGVKLDGAGGKQIKTGLVRITQIICVFYLAFALCGQSKSWRVQSARQRITRSAIAAGAETIVLPEVPYSGTYCYGANIQNDNDYWMANYKRYYNIPMDTKVEFKDYYKWSAEDSGN